jgi:hypothetical protein
MNLFFLFFFHKTFVLSLSYLRMLSDDLFLKAELHKKIGLKTSKKGPGAPVIDIHPTWHIFLASVRKTSHLHFQTKIKDTNKMHKTLS